jgi:hypothetical protein
MVVASKIASVSNIQETPGVQQYEGMSSPSSPPELYSIIVVYWLKTEHNN